MSYSLICQCDLCIKKDRCNDRHFIAGGISGIHNVWPQEKGHLGSGSVELKCNNFEEKE